VTDAAHEPLHARPGPVLLPPSKRCPVRYFAGGRIVGLTEHAQKRCLERHVAPHDVAARLLPVNHVPYLALAKGRGKHTRRFRGADGLVAVAAPWKAGWIVISVGWADEPEKPT